MFCIKTSQDCRKLSSSLQYIRISPRSGGGGAPIRSACGHLVTSFRDDPILGFNDPLRNYVDLELRYKVSPRKKKHYKMQLGRSLSFVCLFYFCIF